MIITQEAVKALKPCRARFDNFTTNYPNYSGTIEQFIKLENISYSDKVWVLNKILSNEVVAAWAKDRADSVAHLNNCYAYLAKYPTYAYEAAQFAAEAVAYTTTTAYAAAAYAAYADYVAAHVAAYKFKQEENLQSLIAIYYKSIEAPNA